jgi:hypothetical protein
LPVSFDLLASSGLHEHLSLSLAYIADLVSVFFVHQNDEIIHV